MSAPFEVTFLEKLQRLLAEGSYTSTYKFAVLLGLVDLCVEARPGTDSFTTAQLTRKVAEVYWRQVAPLDGVALRQSGQRATILGAVERLRGAARGPSMAAAEVELPREFRRMLGEVELSLIRMPLPRLQTLPSGADAFLYEIGWTLHDVVSRRIDCALREYQRGGLSPFDNRIAMRPGVVETLARFQGLVRELVEARWVRKVRDLNRTRNERDLQEHLFGLDRAALAPVAQPLLSLHGGRCFYCDGKVVRPHVDHFLPWARYPDNRLINLVPAHDACNGAKSAYLAASEHLERWLDRGVSRKGELEGLAAELHWASGDGSVAAGRVLYAQQPETARLWFARGEFRALERGRVDAAFAAVTAAPYCGT